MRMRVLDESHAVRGWLAHVVVSEQGSAGPVRTLACRLRGHATSLIERRSKSNAIHIALTSCRGHVVLPRSTRQLAGHERARLGRQNPDQAA